MNETLLPCPFCGVRPTTQPSGEHGRGLMIDCSTPNCVNPHTSYYDHATAIAVWNRRASSAVEGVGDFQSRVQPWMMDCFGAEISADKLERNDRFIEEALELVQATSYPKDRAHALVEYVYGRPQGDINQEVGGVMVTLAAHCLANGVNMHDAAETELARIWTKVEQIRAKQAAKPKGSALPIAVPASPTRAETVEECAREIEHAVNVSRKASFESLSADVGWATGGGHKFDPSYFAGHQSVPINFNSLARIVDKNCLRMAEAIRALSQTKGEKT